MFTRLTRARAFGATILWLLLWLPLLNGPTAVAAAGDRVVQVASEHPAVVARVEQRFAASTLAATRRAADPTHPAMLTPRHLAAELTQVIRAAHRIPSRARAHRLAALAFPYDATAPPA